jgi:hypothetical protein
MEVSDILGDDHPFDVVPPYNRDRL